MLNKLYKVKSKTGDGIFGRFRIIQGCTQWLCHREANSFLASGFAVPSVGTCAPYYGVAEIPGVVIATGEPSCPSFSLPANAILTYCDEAKPKDAEPEDILADEAKPKGRRSAKP